MATGSSTTVRSRISQRAAAIAPSATLAVDAAAKALQAAGEHVIGFGAGEPDFPTPLAIVEAAHAACREPAVPPLHANGRVAGPPRGDRGEDQARLGPRRPAVPGARHQRRKAGGRPTPSRSCATRATRCLVLAPYWTTYPEAVALAGGVPVFVPSDETTGFRAPVEALEAAPTERTKVLLFVSPSNPTGAVYPRAEVEAIGRWAVERGLWVVTDEIYEHLVYGSAEHHSMPVARPRAGRELHRDQRGRQDLRHDRLARRVADRAARRGRPRRPTSSPTRPPTWPTSPRRPLWPQSRAT